MKLAFSKMPELERKQPEIMVGLRPEVPPPLSPDEEASSELVDKHQTSAETMRGISWADLNAATGGAAPFDAGFDKDHRQAMDRETRSHASEVFTPPGCPAPEGSWLHSFATLAGKAYKFGGVTAGAVDDPTALSNRLWSLQTQSSYWTLVDAPRKACVQAYPRRFVHRRPSSFPEAPPPPPSAAIDPAAVLRRYLQPTGARSPHDDVDNDETAAARAKIAASINGQARPDAPGAPAAPVVLPVTPFGLLRGPDTFKEPAKVAPLTPQSAKSASRGYVDRMAPPEEGEPNKKTGILMQTSASGTARAGAGAGAGPSAAGAAAGPSRARGQASAPSSAASSAPARAAFLQRAAAAAKASHAHPAAAPMRRAAEAWAAGDGSAASRHHAEAVSLLQTGSAAASATGASTGSTAGDAGRRPLPSSPPGAGPARGPADVEGGGWAPVAPSQARALPHSPDALWELDLATSRWARPVTAREALARLVRAVDMTAGGWATAGELPQGEVPFALLQERSRSGARESVKAANDDASKDKDKPKAFMAAELPAWAEQQDVLENMDVGGAEGVPAVGPATREKGIGLARPQPRVLSSMVALQGGLLLFGGASPTWQLLGDAWFFDPADGDGQGRWWCVWGCPAHAPYAYRSPRTGGVVVAVPSPQPASMTVPSPPATAAASLLQRGAAAARTSGGAAGRDAERVRSRLRGSGADSAGTALSGAHASDVGSAGGAALQPADPMAEMAVPGARFAAGPAVRGATAPAPAPRFAASNARAGSAGRSGRSRAESDGGAAADDDAPLDDDQDSGDRDLDGDGGAYGDGGDGAFGGRAVQNLPSGPNGPGDVPGRRETDRQGETTQGEQAIPEGSVLPAEARGVPTLPFDKAIDGFVAAAAATSASAEASADSVFPPREGHTAVVMGARIPKGSLALPAVGMHAGLPSTKTGTIDPAFKLEELGLKGAPASTLPCGKPSAATDGSVHSCTTLAPASVVFGTLKKDTPADGVTLASSRKEMMVVYGGVAAGHDAGLEDAWAFALQPEPAWYRIAGKPGFAKPPLRWLHTASTVSVRDRDPLTGGLLTTAAELMLVFGGCARDARALDDAWALNPAEGTWHPLKARGERPSARWLAAGAAVRRPDLPRPPHLEEGLGNGDAGDIFDQLDLSVVPALHGSSKASDIDQHMLRRARSDLEARKLVDPVKPKGAVMLQTGAGAGAEAGAEAGAGAGAEAGAEAGARAGAEAGDTEETPVPGPMYGVPDLSDRSHMLVIGGASHGAVLDDMFSLHLLESAQSIADKASPTSDANAKPRPQLPGAAFPWTHALEAQWELVAPSRAGPSGLEGATAAVVEAGTNSVQGVPLLGDGDQWVLLWGGARDPIPDGGRLGDSEGLPAALFADVAARPMLYPSDELEPLRQGAAARVQKWGGKGQVGQPLPAELVRQAKQQSAFEESEQDRQSLFGEEEQGSVGEEEDETSVGEEEQGPVGEEEEGSVGEEEEGPVGEEEQGSVGEEQPFALLMQRRGGAAAGRRSGRRGSGADMSHGGAEDTGFAAERRPSHAALRRASHRSAVASPLQAETGDTSGDGASLTDAMAARRSAASRFKSDVDLARELEELVRPEPETLEPGAPVAPGAKSSFIEGGPARPPRQLGVAMQTEIYMAALLDSDLGPRPDTRWQRLLDVMPVNPVAAAARAEAAVVYEEAFERADDKAEQKAAEKEAKLQEGGYAGMIAQVHKDTK
ncbi:hypothetical protein FNF31_06424 [Cafeteria roenbergensis]|uniref:Uncharacterized protein n=1 Tax=Cafeteria roenbergensis TaxID=33653 RepID=A0A5A8CPM5_CAFRO|nr:hypothetical protein FNF31_06424 [Cafeteria roenbergensis]